MEKPLRISPHLAWLEAGDEFPPVTTAHGPQDAVPGLLAAGGALNVATLVKAYSNGIFPWFSDGQPILWWSPSPRMVLKTVDFKLHRSLRKSVHHFLSDTTCSIRFDTAFDRVIKACASKPRAGQRGTWIVPEMVAAYIELHRAGNAHSVETWVGNALVGGLYCVNIGHMVFGESMFAHQTDASKIALTALVAFCKVQGISAIDCQQNTQHLESLGAREIPREAFTQHLQATLKLTKPVWQFDKANIELLLKPEVSQ